ncbi:hypothetical protein K488DRAFT_48819 [Vararia minispora EC-137]|uniref:Uncharacterized protein n=1 Tax=Vararia minispora EC-137 TaxID=1314806 RepID=A0ACB8QMQ6_9AGAM|nr:hypothetical protein K488DRAFT_48819 [Vararia minispora EC-137]
MTDQAAARRTLQDLIRREDLKNKVCADCNNPNPQWASVSFAVFICLQCAGQHRGYGVHISFVRSVSMDTWSDDQIRRMQLGGNGPFHDFLAAYAPAEQGGYAPGMPAHDKYHCWAATQYREKLDFALQDKPWTPSPPPPDAASPPGSRPSSAQGLRKSRAGAASSRGPSTISRTGSSSPVPSASPLGSPTDQKAANEAYFASLGSTNAARPDSLPPSQGGRYTGFGNTPSPQPGGHPSFGLSSRNAPTFSDLQENPMAALSKGWSLFAGAVAGAGKAINDNVLQPGMERVQDPAFQASVRGYVQGAGRTIGQAGASANEWGRNQFGVDVAEGVGGLMGGGRERAGYGRVAQGGPADETSALYHDDEDDMFSDFAGEGSRAQPATKPSGPPVAKAKDGWDDDWKDF